MSPLPALRTAAAILAAAGALLVDGEALAADAAEASASYGTGAPAAARRSLPYGSGWEARQAASAGAAGNAAGAVGAGSLSTTTTRLPVICP